MSKLKIAVDCDSVLSGDDFIIDQVAIYNERYDDNVNWKDINEWDITKFLTKCTKKQCFEILTPQFFLDRQPRFYAREMIEELKAMGHDVFIVTMFSPKVIEAKIEWIKKYIGLDEMDIMLCNNKYRVDCDVLIDDHVGNFKGFLDNGKSIVSILVSQPHNMVNDLREYYRVSCLTEVVEIIESLTKK